MQMQQHSKGPQPFLQGIHNIKVEGGLNIYTSTVLTRQVKFSVHHLDIVITKQISLKNKRGPGKMAHVYYPSYAEGGDGRSKSEASQGKKLT
jgi:hypothetical protein